MSPVKLAATKSAESIRTVLSGTFSFPRCCRLFSSKMPALDWISTNTSDQRTQQTKGNQIDHPSKTRHRAWKSIINLVTQHISWRLTLWKISHAESSRTSNSQQVYLWTLMFCFIVLTRNKKKSKRKKPLMTEYHELEPIFCCWNFIQKLQARVAHENDELLKIT